jgi:hypothetical protein
MSRTQYAKSRKARGLRGGTYPSVKGAIDTGRIAGALLEGGRLDPELADRLWEENTRASSANGDGHGYNEARAEVQKLKAQQLADELAVRRGGLVPSSAVFERAREPLEAVARAIDEMPRAMARRHYKRLKLTQGAALAFFEELAEELRAPLRAIFEEEG